MPGFVFNWVAFPVLIARDHVARRPHAMVRLFVFASKIPQNFRCFVTSPRVAIC